MINHDAHFLTPYYKQEPKSPSEHITKLLETQELLLKTALKTQQNLDEFNIKKREESKSSIKYFVS